MKYFLRVYRAKQSRRAMIKHQIETMLNIKGKDMPSVEEEFGSAGNDFYLSLILISFFTLKIKTFYIFHKIL